MKKWQEERNYRRVRSEGGEVIANIITVDGVDVEVAEDVYLAYSQADRRERYVREEQFSGKILSLEQMAEDAPAVQSAKAERPSVLAKLKAPLSQPCAEDKIRHRNKEER